MRRAIALVVLSSLVPLAGCSVSNSVTGRATKETPSELFDPCTLPHDALHAIGVDPGSASQDFFGVQAEGWDACTWKAEWYFVTVTATSDVTVEEFRARPRTTDFHAVELGNREAYTFRSTYESQLGLCDLVYSSSQGTLMLRANTQAGMPMHEDPCSVVIRTAATLDPYIPE